MSRRLIVLFTMAAGALSFSSCTCHSTTPEAPPKLAAPSGFGAVVTPRKIPERVAEDVTTGQITPQGIEPKGAPSPPPAAKEPVSVPDNFPEGIPIPEGSEVLASQTLANKANSVVFGTDGDAPKIFNLYKDEMQKNGWGPPFQEAQGKDQSFLSFKKGSTITNISISKDPKSGRRVVAVMYYEEQPLPFPEF